MADARAHQALPSAAVEHSPLKRQLGFIDAAAIYVGIILGSGIFFAPSNVAAAAPDLGSALALWGFGGLVALCGALVYAECGARLPHDGGFYVFYREAFGEGAAFVGGFVALAITYPASIAVVAIILGRYLGELVPALAGYEAASAAVAVALATALNLVGVRENAWSQRILTGAKVAAVVLLCAAALFADGPAAPVAVAEPVQAGGFAALLMALVGVLWTYSGWSDVTLVAGELEQPARNLGRTVLLGTVVVVVLYGVVQTAVALLLPAGVAASSERVLSDAVGAAFGSDMSRIVAGLVVLSTFGAINAVTLVVSRLGYAMARDGVIPRVFASVHPRLGTPARMLFAVAAITGVYVFSSSFRDLLGLFTFSVWFFYGLTAVALLLLRRRRVGEPLAWRAPGGILPPAVILLTGAFMTVSLLAEESQRQQALLGLGLLLAGIPAYLLWRRFGR